jgi:hypothetical protein
VTHPLQQLSAGAFQSLAPGLTIAEFGAGVQAMGVGPDGGRDAYLHGPLKFGPAERSASEDGATHPPPDVPSPNASGPGPR